MNEFLATNKSDSILDVGFERIYKVAVLLICPDWLLARFISLSKFVRTYGGGISERQFVGTLLCHFGWEKDKK